MPVVVLMVGRQTTRRSVWSEHVSEEMCSEPYLYEAFGLFIIHNRRLGAVMRSCFSCPEEPHTGINSQTTLLPTSAGLSKQGKHTYGAAFHLTRIEATFQHSLDGVATAAEQGSRVQAPIECGHSHPQRRCTTLWSPEEPDATHPYQAGLPSSHV